MENNPYTAPVGSSHEISTGSGTIVPSAAVEQLAATKPWVRFMSVITFVCAGFMLLIGAFMAVAGGAGMFAAASKGGASPVLAGSMGTIIAIIYAVLALVYIFPGLKLWKYASAIGRLIQSGSEEDLVAALNQQRSFWKFVGILVLSMLVLYVVIIIAGAAFAGFAAAAKH